MLTVREATRHHNQSWKCWLQFRPSAHIIKKHQLSNLQYGDNISYSWLYSIYLWRNKEIIYEDALWKIKSSASMWHHFHEPHHLTSRFLFPHLNNLFQNLSLHALWIRGTSKKKNCCCGNKTGCTRNEWYRRIVLIWFNPVIGSTNVQNIQQSGNLSCQLTVIR